MLLLRIDNQLMKKHHIPFFKPSFSKDEEEAVLAVLRSGWLTTGKETLAFEKEFAAFIGSSCALAVNSASSGLMLALKAFGVGPGDAVATTPYTYISTATAALHLGAELVYCDIEKDSYNIDPERLKDALKADKNIKAVIPVHIAGNPCDMAAINALAREAGAAVIEDAAHALPAKTAAGFAGALGDAGVFSFYATKTITTGEGGMIVLKSPEMAEAIKRLRMNGISCDVWGRYTEQNASWKYDVVELGWKCNMPDILAAIGRVQLKKALSLFEKRKRLAALYTASFSNLDFLIPPPDADGNAWHLYLLRIREDKLSISRDEFAALLQAEGIGISMHFIPHFDFTLMRQRLKNFMAKDFPNAAQKSACTISLPFWPDMGEEEAQRVIDAVVKIGKKHYKLSS